jgi:hypothetical protein
MFDALEQKFKHTDQADLIQRLYEGKILVLKCVLQFHSSVYLLMFASRIC